MRRASLTNILLLVAITLLAVAFVVLRSPVNVSAQSSQWKVMLISPNDFGAKELEAELNNGKTWKNVTMGAAGNGNTFVVLEH